MLLWTMYSINVFLTFSLTEIGNGKSSGLPDGKNTSGMEKVTAGSPDRPRSLSFHLNDRCVEKFQEGAWMTVVVTSVLILLCVIIPTALSTRQHKTSFSVRYSGRDFLLKDSAVKTEMKLDANKPTAILLVESYNGLGITASEIL